jgi:hypothetical protein
MAAGPDDHGGLSAEVRLIASQALRRAATAPHPADIKAMEALALSQEREAMTPAEIRALAARALTQAQQISSLMNRLADLIGEPPDGDVGRG